MSSEARANLFRQFATMLDAGLPISRCLGILSQESYGKLSRAAVRMQQRIDAGWTLTDAAAEEPAVFSGLQVSHLKAAEASGHLDSVLLKMADAQEASSRLRRRFIGKLIYPAVLLHAAAIVPAVVTLFLGSTADALRQIAVILVPAYLLVFLLLLVRRVGGQLGPFRHLRDRVVCAIPVVGGTVRKIGLARFARTFESLHSAGLDIFESLKLSAEATGNAVMEWRLKKAEDALRNGQTLAAALEGTRAFSPMINGMIATGEESGKLDAMFAKIAEQAELDAQTSIDRMSKIIPGLIYLALVIWVGMQVVGMMGQYVNMVNDAMR